MPERMLRSTFSTTTIASSTTMPTARTSPKSERLFSDIPSGYRTANVPTRETGIAITGIIEALQFCRNRNTTPSTRRMAMKIDMTTSRTDFAINVDMIHRVPRSWRLIRDPGRAMQVLGGQCREPITAVEIVRRTLVGFEPDAHGVLAAALELHISNTFEARENVLDVQGCVV